jgi:hypothetical protein
MKTDNVIANQIFWAMHVNNIVNEFKHEYNDELFKERMSAIGYSKKECKELIASVEKDVANEN